MDPGGAFHQANFSIFGASYVVALHINEAKKPHAIAETLVKSCHQICAKIPCMSGLATSFKKFFFLMTESRAESSKCLAI